MVADGRYNEKHRFGDKTAADCQTFKKKYADAKSERSNMKVIRHLKSKMADDRQLENRHIAIFQ